MRLRLFALLAGLGACSTFTESTNGGGVDGGGVNDPPADTGTAEGGTDAGGTPDAGSSHACATFGTMGVGVPSEWAPDLVAGKLGMSAVDNRPCMEATVMSAYERAGATRDLTFASVGELEVTVDLQVKADATTVVGWLANVVTVACVTPKVQVSLEVTPGSLLMVESTPAGPTPPVALGPANVDGLALLSLGFADDKVTILYRGVTNVLTLPASLSGAKGCTLTVGAVAIGNVPRVTADIAEACVQAP